MWILTIYMYIEHRVFDILRSRYMSCINRLPASGYITAVSLIATVMGSPVLVPLTRKATDCLHEPAVRES